ncbi:uncharacterized protein SOCEGT47_042940 [Sorangium cellulosum]|uniref:Uncharacterized protein n=1 Tax=Sorangium cellulosum TaxID=56 RepID=A0A4P2Q380_SORCE|nr:uncharacterized protein SOCEGT47_042940 [Sorangium cellulosum]
MKINPEAVESLPGELKINPEAVESLPGELKFNRRLSGASRENRNSTGGCREPLRRIFFHENRHPTGGWPGERQGFPRDQGRT